MYKKFIKRWFDIIGSCILLILLSPLLIFILLILIIPTKGHVLFIQQRPGLNEKPFLLLKFRNMNEKKDLHGILLSEEQRITPIGRILRRTNLDELPQLINVLKGDMSLIGPRPLLMDYLPLYNPTQLKRHLVKPGITGWAQLNGGNDIEWEKKFEYDVVYATNLSFKFDLKIILLTLQRILSGKGFNTGKKIMDKFRGNSTPYNPL